MKTDEVVFKSDQTTTVSRINTAIGGLVVKRYNTKNPWHLIRRNFQTSRAMNCIRMARIFQQNGIAVAEPVAVIENQWGFFSGRSWYVTKYVEKEMLLDYLSVERWQAGYDNIKNQIHDLFSVLQHKRLSHGDMKATNILVSENGIVLLDLDASKRHYFSYFHRRALKRDRSRFLKNWKHNPPLHDGFATLLSFLEE